MIDRKNGPKIHGLQSLILPEIEVYTLPNGATICITNLGKQDILRIEIIHKAGRIVENKHLVARATATLLKDGFGGVTSAELAEKLDFYGATIKTASNLDFSFTTIHTLTKRAKEIVPLLAGMYTEPTFPQNELKKFIEVNIERLKEDLNNNDILSYRLITEEIFGSSHPYGYNSTFDDFSALEREDLINHFHQNYCSNNCFIFLSGRIDDVTRQLIEQYFGQFHREQMQIEYKVQSELVGKKSIIFKSINQHQTSLKIGRKLFNRANEDNIPFFVANTILGGYFGSRLMKSIREDFGYTYDISTFSDQMLYDGSFYIGTEADGQYIIPIIEQIKIEFDRLKQTKVSIQELEMVKNYIMGNYLNMLDGPINVSSIAKSMILNDLPLGEFIHNSERIMQIQQEEIMNMAIKYFDLENMIEVLVEPSNRM